MVAYAALVSLTNIIETIQNHPHPPVSLDRRQVDSLLERVTFLQEFLEVHSPGEAYPTDGLESLITDVAGAAEDAIESYIVDHIGGSTSPVEGSNNAFYQDPQKAIEKMDFIKKEAAQIKEKAGVDKDHQNLSLVSDASLVSPGAPSLGQSTIVVGLDNLSLEILDKLTNRIPEREIIPIVGMGGSGKTTLATKVYKHALVMEHFDIRVWITISQKFKAHEALLEILSRRNPYNIEAFSHMSKEDLGKNVFQSFFGRSYLIVLDDIWSIKAWDEIQRFFPTNDNGSRIIITTRISDVASQLTNSPSIKMHLLDEEESWNLFCKHVFGEDACPFDLEEIGGRIVKNCKGLPLAIVVVGGLLAKSKQSKRHWEDVAEDVAKNVSSNVNLNVNEHCLRILHMSYRQLPIHLKSCFLYMGIFPEDSRIHVSWLVKQLVAEGFLKPIRGKVVEDIAKEYIKDLVNRNLISVDKWGCTGDIKVCKIHDLLRDLCLREARKEKFLYLTGEYNLGINGERRIVVCRNTLIKEHASEVPDGFLSRSLARSLICNRSNFAPCAKFRLLRVWKAVDKDRFHYRERCTKFEEFYNLRYLAIGSQATIHSSINLFWNLQTLIFKGDEWRRTTAPIEIWKIPQLRHVEVANLELPSPPDDNLVLWNLRTLSRVTKFKCSDKVVERIPNIKKLVIDYSDVSDGFSNYCLNNLEHLYELKHLRCFFGEAKNLQQNLTFPHSIKKLVLVGIELFWDDINTKTGSLPCLEKLELENISGREWMLVEGQFLRLKFLNLSSCLLECLTIESTHFPLLEFLGLCGLHNLLEIPSDVGELPGLKCIEVYGCKDPVLVSARSIAEAREELEDYSLLIRVWPLMLSRELLSLASRNFQVEKDESWQKHVQDGKA